MLAGVSNGQNTNSVALDGEWDFFRKEQLLEMVGELNSDRPALIDLRRCTYADSTVLGVLVALKKKFGNVPITLLGPHSHVLRILKVVGFDKLFAIRTD